MVGWCSSPRFADHNTGRGHPERGDRIRAIYAALHRQGLLAGASPFADFAVAGSLPDAAGVVLKDLAEPAPVGDEVLGLVHPAEHIERIEALCAAGGGTLDGGDTVLSRNSAQIARLAVGAVVRCCDAVMAGQVRRAFAAVRPPGHHAEPLRAMGFCLFNNIAIAARHLQVRHGVERVAIVDFDVHHGNGTQAAFHQDPRVLFVSLHQDPRTCYPNTGFAWEIGVGDGRGTTLNVPILPGADDAEFLQAVEGRAIAALERFSPDAILISAGFDAHRDDPLAQLQLSDAAYFRTTRLIADAADRLCGGRIISVLEGGYDLGALSRGVIEHLRGLAGPAAAG